MPFPTPPDPTAERLRRRALLLRTLSRAVHHLDMLELHRHAGTDVWVGPSQQHWDDTMRTDRAALARAGRELHQAARRLEQRADDLERLGAPERGAVR
jgi:hypothetical protein